MKSVALLGYAFLIGCAGTPYNLSTEQIDAVELMYGKPGCAYTSLGSVSGGDGHTGNPSGMIWGPRGSDKRALQELRANAALLGADAVIVMHRRGGERERPSGSISKRAARRVEFAGTAIRSCEATPNHIVHGRFGMDGEPIENDDEN